ncbi:hypothetical protein [Halovivax cerinus]|uniref:YokE-like PH domain-containing protein n=1 Tax=Halovivax cerinus TaxID=1487865 RepID=A0ABD5NLA3_9EURY|nr:hypothetical protein [Halovivax cerinus]
MRLDEYTIDGESVITSVEGYYDKNAVGETESGTLAMTDNRLVFIHNKGALDISLGGVNALEYRKPEYPGDYLGGGLLAASLAVGVFSMGTILDHPLTEIAPILGVLFAVVGVVLIAVGYFRKGAKMTLHTGNTSFEFISKDESLQDVARALRAYE